MGGDFIEGKEKYCLWMPNINPKTLLNLPVTLKELKKLENFVKNPEKSYSKKLKLHIDLMKLKFQILMNILLFQ